ASLPAGTEGWAFYGRDPEGHRWILVCPDGRREVVASSEENLLRVDLERAPLPASPRVTWRFFRKGFTVDVGGLLLFDLSDADGWRFWWVETPRPPTATKLYRVDFEDGFMRTALGDGDRWQPLSGTWALKQYGGGMPTNEREARDANYRRAANAFSLLGANGAIAQGTADWVNYYAEARFFFGRPDSFARRDTLERTVLGGEPVYRDPEAIYASDQIHEYPDGDFFVAQGLPGNAQAAFGWCAPKRRFELRTRLPGAGDWDVVRAWHRRPYFTNWVRIGLGTLRGCRLMPFLDGDQLGAYRADVTVSGPLVLVSAGGTSECDDIVAAGFPRPSQPGAPVFEESANFAQKELLPKKDVQTGQWTRSELVFEDEADNLRIQSMSRKRCQFPFYGDFTYQPAADLPEGNYCLAFVDARNRAGFRAFFTKTAKGWERPGGGCDPELVVGRRGGALLRRRGDTWESLAGRRLAGTVYLVIAADSEAALDPARHPITSNCLTHELFEKAPTEWAWREGNFRMDVRWQCQRGWNFMMGKSRDLAVMFTKAAYEGDQDIEFHIALRFVTPPPYYVLRDMGFAFCTDGRSLGSGYTLIYGDEDNTATTLLRHGKPVERVACSIRNKPGANIHNYWWHGRVRREDRTITVEIDDEMVIRFRDPSPLKGGHVAFWTCRNAISLAKVSINAEHSENRAAAFTMPAAPLPEGPWLPLNPDEVTVTERGGQWQAVNENGGGTFGLRCVLPRGGVEIDRNSRLILPLRLDRDTRVGIHVQVSGRSFYYPLTSSTERVRGLLTPEWEGRAPDAVFRVGMIGKDAMKELLLSGRHSSNEVVLGLGTAAAAGNGRGVLESVTLGNASNEDYLLLGAAGNPPGSALVVGLPEVR
ncbi:MAG: hypothetical protein JXR77_12180, partial [Lentisphaeria bacterium]|nr:hypothetical protein [Lentisphaeria bacterium]